MKKILFACAIIAVPLLIYGFLFGPLFPYSPLKIDFAEEHFSWYTLIYPKSTNLSPEYLALGSLFDEAETFHRLRFKKPVKIIVCATIGQYKRFSLAGGRACTAQTGTIIYISPMVKNAKYPPNIAINKNHTTILEPPHTTPRDLASFLKHELSHALLYQNTSLFKALNISRWFEEGFAVYFGNSHHYYQGAQLKTLAVDQGYFFDLFDDKAEPEGIPREIKYYFMYGIYSEFMNYLITTYGVDRVLNFMTEYLTAPKDEEQLFASFFGVSPQEALERFFQHLKQT